MTTVKVLLVTKFNEFVENVKHIVPDIEKVICGYGDIDHLEVMKVLLFLFPDDKLNFHLDQVLELKNIQLTDDKKQQLLPFIEIYIQFLRKLDVMLNA